MEEKIEEVKKAEAKEPECPLCQVTPILMAIGTGHTACSTLTDPEKKATCMAWAEKIKPEEIKDAAEIFVQMIDNAGIDAVDKAAKIFNMGVEAAIVRRVGEKLKTGENVSKKEMDLYKQFTMSKGV